MSTWLANIQRLCCSIYYSQALLLVDRRALRYLTLRAEPDTFGTKEKKEKKIEKIIIILAL